MKVSNYSLVSKLAYKLFRGGIQSAYMGLESSY